MQTKVTLTEFGDYECTHCGAAYPILKKIQAKYGDKINFEFKNFPLIEAHPFALMAAEAAEEARAQGRFEEMHDALFENQDELDEEVIFSLAKDIGLDTEEFGDALADHVHQAQIQEDIKDGMELGVQGTPSLFINGGEFRQTLTFEGLSRIIDIELGHGAESHGAHY